MEKTIWGLGLRQADLVMCQAIVGRLGVGFRVTGEGPAERVMLLCTPARYAEM